MVWMTVARMDKGAMRGTNQAGQIALQLLRVVMLLCTGVLRPCVHCFVFQHPHFGSFMITTARPHDFAE